MVVILIPTFLPSFPPAFLLFSFLSKANIPEARISCQPASSSVPCGSNEGETALERDSKSDLNDV